MRLCLTLALFAAHAGSPSAVRLTTSDDAEVLQDTPSSSLAATSTGWGIASQPAVLEPIENAPAYEGDPAWPVSWDKPWVEAFEPDYEAWASAGSDGEVDFLYTFGAPGAGSPGLQNQRSNNGCFNGLRAWQTLKGRIWGKWVDIAVRITNYVWYAHAKITVLDIQTGDVENSWNPVVCDDTTSMKLTWEPAYLYFGTAGLHMQPKYIASMHTMDQPWLTNMSIFAADTAYEKNPDDVRENIVKHGWRLAGSALHPGGWLYGGRQISHLIQQPETLECVVTFQGTASLQGWVSNFDWLSTHFCGLSLPGESCRFHMFGCKTRQPRGSFVHSGFSGRLRVLAKSVEWQHNVHRFLPSCKKVHVVGHSLGGSMGELFSACVSRAPAPEEFGWEDYKWIGWKTGTPTALPWLLP